jgi:site-specific DNA-cytosine methylase
MFSKSGDKITNDLLEICDKNGYSLSYYKTNSIYHQGAQNRVRNFFFLWKGSQVPLMENIDNGSTNFEDYLNNVSGLQGSELMIVPNLTNNYIYKYMKYLNLDIRKELSIHTDCYNWAINNNKIDDIIKYYENDKNTDEYKKSIRLKNKKENDESIWHNYPCFYQKITPPIITKTLRRTLHPFEDRGLSIREAMRLMGFPDDYSFPLKSKFKLITKNVPVNTAKDMVSIAKDMVSIAKDFINKKLILKSVKFDKFDNTNEKIERDCDDW